jgi:hypothetical protein
MNNTDKLELHVPQTQSARLLYLGEAAAHRIGKGTPLFEVLLELGYLNAVMGFPAPDVLGIVRTIACQPDWNPLDDWQHRIAQADATELVAGLEPPEAEQKDHRRRAEALASWLLRHEGEPMAEKVVIAAQKVCLEQMKEARHDAA